MALWNSMFENLMIVEKNIINKNQNTGIIILYDNKMYEELTFRIILYVVISFFLIIDNVLYIIDIYAFVLYVIKCIYI